MPCIVTCLSLFLCLSLAMAAVGAAEAGRPGSETAPAAVEAERLATPDVRGMVVEYSADRAALGRRYDAAWSEERRARLRRFYRGWLERIGETPREALDREAQLDLLLLEGRARYELTLLDREEADAKEVLPLLPFLPDVVRLHEARRKGDPVDARAAAAILSEIPAAVDALRKRLEFGGQRADAQGQLPQVGSRKAEGGASDPAGEGGTAPAGRSAGPRLPRRISPVLGSRAVEALEGARTLLRQWHQHYSGYDPLFTWWTAAPYRRADEALNGYLRALRERVVGQREGQEAPIVARPIGQKGIEADLLLERIPYSLKELVAVAEQQFAWCEREMQQAAAEMGFGSDWRAALEKVKSLHVEPGRQPELVRKLAQEAIDFVEQRNLVTVPPLAKEIWRLEMMSPEAQRVNPFFLGGEVIRVAFPTDAMSHEDKLMSLRGNNIHFARATVHHELIPGHHLQGFMNARHQPHRQAFGTPFWTEGWALYWEMLLWDLGFPRTPEDRVGMLFWRMHRAARIVFSLRVHLGSMTPAEAVDFLVGRVGHERANAQAEVRRSFGGSYPPLYQAAYMLGGLQFRALHRELVDSGRMTARQFHDGILQGGPMPVELVRARLTGELPAPGAKPAWRFLAALDER